MNNTENPLIGFLGTYDRSYSRNQTLFKGLNELGLKLEEVHVELRQTEFYSKKHIGIFPLLHRIARKLSLIPEVIRNLRKIKKWDVIFIAYPGHLDVPIGWIVGKLLGKPIVFDPTFSLFQILTSDFQVLNTKSFKALIIKFAEKIIFSLPNVILADSPFQKEYYVKTFRIRADKVALLPIGANTDAYPYQGYYDSKNKQFNVVYYGLFNPLHGLEYVIDCAKVCESDTAIRFLFIGKGQTYLDMTKKAKDLNLKNVEFYSEVTEKDALPILAKADVFLGFFQNSPTVFRTIPNKVLQGLALGKVVVTAATPAINSVFTHKDNIYTCEVASGNSLAASIMDLKKHPALKKQISRKGYLLFRDRFTASALAENLLNTIRSIA